MSKSFTFDFESFFVHNLLITNRQVSGLCKAFVNSSSADIKLSGRFFGRLLGPLLKLVYFL